MVQIWATSNIVLSYTDLHHTQTVETRLGASWVKFESISVNNFQFFWGLWLVIFFGSLSISVNEFQICLEFWFKFLFLGSVGIVICWTSLSCKYPKHTITVTGTWYVAGLYALILFSLFYLWCLTHSPALSPGAVSRTWAWLGGGAPRGGGRGGTFPGTQSLVLAGYYSDWLGINPCSGVFSLHLL